MQEEGVDAILKQQDLLMILPTGGGKSLVYQLPTMMMEGITIVISPLIALMQDQVASLQAQNIAAQMISSAQTHEEVQSVLTQARNNTLKFLYLSPERLNNDTTIAFLHQLNINFFVIDEAHCISQWGHEFRSDYRALGQLKANFPHTTIAAFTATSTHNVTHDILRELHLQNPLLLKGSIFRENLFISVQRRISNGHAQLKNFLLRHTDESGIIYVSSRKKAQDLSNFLNQNGYKSLPYHAGLPQHIREQNFKLFVNDTVNIMVATIAFGMGIDKSDIRFVVHMSLPKSQENYYQEIGRAGRDSEASEVLLLFNASDIHQHKHFLLDIADEEYKKHLNQKIEQIYKYATSEVCFHQQLAHYFDDTIKPCETSCDNCLDTDDARKDITQEAQMVLSTIYKTGQSFGKNYIIDILRGSNDQKLLNNQAHKLSVYAIGKSISKKEWFVIVERLLELHVIEIGEFQSLKLTQKALGVLKSQETIDIKHARLKVDKRETHPPHKKEMIEYDKELFEALRQQRTAIAKKLGIPPYLIFSDKVLKNLAHEMPTTKEEMLEVNGVGLKKFAQFGEEFLQVINTSE